MSHRHKRRKNKNKHNKNYQPKLIETRGEDTMSDYNYDYSRGTTPASSSEKPTVRILYTAYAKLMTYIKNVENEVGGIGHVRTTDTGDLLVDDVFLIEQTVSSAATNLSPEGVAKFLVQQKRKNPNDDLMGYQLWWHSHYNFGTFWSGTDTSTIKELGENFDWLLSIVGNQKGDLLARVDMTHPFKASLENLEITHGYLPDNATEEILQEIAEKVKTHTPTYQAPKTIIVKPTEEEAKTIIEDKGDGIKSEYRIFSDCWYYKQVATDNKTYYVFDIAYNTDFEFDDDGLPCKDSTGKKIYPVLTEQGYIAPKMIVEELFYGEPNQA